MWRPLGTDDNAPYRVFHDVSGLPKGTLVEYRAVVKDNAGHLSATSSYGVVGAAPKPVGGGVGDVAQPAAVSIAGTLNSAMGCGGDWMPACPRAQLSLDATDHIWKGTFSLPATQVPPASYTVKVGGGADIPFTVPDLPGVIPTFSFDGSSHVLTVTTRAPGVKPDLSVAAAHWLNRSTTAYPVNRLPAGVDPSWLRFRLHWGTLAVDATGLGGQFVMATLVPGGPPGFLSLRIDNRTAPHRDQIVASPMVAIGVYDDADRLIDAKASRERRLVVTTSRQRRPSSSPPFGRGDAPAPPPAGSRSG